MITPQPLSAGDKVIIVSTSRMITSDQIKYAIEKLESWGLIVDLADNVYDRFGYFSGDDSVRLKNLQKALDSTEYKAVFCSRGGYGLSRLVDDLDTTGLINSPKWIIGFSDITALHLLLNKHGMESVHGVMPVQFEYEGIEESLNSLKTLLFGHNMSYQFSAHPENVESEGHGEIIGGNLSLLVDSLGTGTEIDTTDKVLFIEEIDEYYYKIDRMFNHLKRAGKLADISGLIVGQFSDLKDTRIPFGQSLYGIVKDKVRYGIPICFEAPIGHTTDNWAIPCGRFVKLSVKNDIVNLKEIERPV